MVPADQLIIGLHVTPLYQFQKESFFCMQSYKYLEWFAIVDGF